MNCNLQKTGWLLDFGRAVLAEADGCQYSEIKRIHAIAAMQVADHITTAGGSSKAGKKYGNSVRL